MRVVMMGTGTFALPTFAALLASRHTVLGLVTQPDRPAGQERGSTRQVGVSLAEMARAHHVPVIQPESVNTPEGIAGVRQFGAELLVVAAYGQILSRDVLAAVAQGGINVHASLLPRYRGAAPVAWAIYHGESRTGVTIIRMSIRLDAGDILAQESLEILAEETAGELEVRLAPLGARLAQEVVDRMETGTLQGTPQDPTQATKAPKLTKEHGLIDWARPAMAVCNQVRAMQPWPSAYTFLIRPDQRALRIIVHRATAQPTGQSTEPPGSLIEEANRFVVASADGGEVELVEVQPAGRRRMSGMEFRRGQRLRPGDRLGAPPGTESIAGSS